MRLQHVLGNPAVRERLRAYLNRRCGRPAIDFLYGYWTFSESTNALVRFEQLRTLVHRLVQCEGEDALTLSVGIHDRLLLDWEEWSHGNRVPADAQLPGLDAAAAEVESRVLSRSALAGAALSTQPLAEGIAA